MRSSIDAQSWLSVPPAPACTSKIGIVVVGLAREQRFEFAASNLGLEPAQGRFRFGDDVLIAFGLAEFDQGHLVVEVLLDACNGAELIVERGALLHHAAGALRIVPEVRVFGLPVQLGKPRARLVDVKDASSAVRRTA